MVSDYMVQKFQEGWKRADESGIHPEDTRTRAGLENLDEIDVGHYCTDCRYFEGEPDFDTHLDRCNMCGCSGDSHRKVAIIAEDPA